MKAAASSPCALARPSAQIRPSRQSRRARRGSTQTRVPGNPALRFRRRAAGAQLRRARLCADGAVDRGTARPVKPVATVKDYRVLGPLEVMDGARRVEIGPGKQRSVLAILLLNANQVVSTDRLVDELWGERPPATAAKALQVYVSLLRKALGRETIVTRSPGYELQVPPGALDLHRFAPPPARPAPARGGGRAPRRTGARRRAAGRSARPVARARPRGPGVRALRAGRGCPRRGVAARRPGGPA